MKNSNNKAKNKRTNKTKKCSKQQASNNTEA